MELHVLSGPQFLNLSSGPEKACPSCLQRLLRELSEDLRLREPGAGEGLLPLHLLGGSQIVALTVQEVFLEVSAKAKT